ncbi:MAG: RNA pseudouridine synthase, partial [Bacteroidota bacterium]
LTSLKGDLKYGYARSNQNKGISLHAFALSFTHPVRKNEMHFSSLPPKDDLWYLFDYYSEENRAKTTSLNP